MIGYRLWYVNYVHPTSASTICAVESLYRLSPIRPASVNSVKETWPTASFMPYLTIWLYAELVT